MQASRPILAVIDEAAPADKAGIYYVLVAAVLWDPDRLEVELASLLPAERTRPFHWSDEGRTARHRMISLIIDGAVVAHAIVHYPTARRGQEAARRLALAEPTIDGHPKRRESRFPT